MSKYHLTGWRENHIQSMEKLEGLEADITLGAHPVFNSTFQKAALMGKANNPFIDPAEWVLMVKSARRQFIEFTEQDPL